jgi:hypothetical protein
MSVRKINLSVGNKPIGTAITYPYPEDDGVVYDIPTYELTVSGTDDAGAAQTRSFEVFRFGVHRPTAKSSAHVVGLASEQTHTIKAWLPKYTVHSADSKEIGAWQVYDGFLIHDGPDDPKTELYASIGCVEICNGPEGFVKFNDFIISLSGSTKKSRGDKLAEIGSSGKMVIHYAKAARPALVVHTGP